MQRIYYGPMLLLYPLKPSAAVENLMKLSLSKTKHFEKPFKPNFTLEDQMACFGFKNGSKIS